MPLEGIAKIKLFILIFFLSKILFWSTTPTENPAISNLPFSYVYGISAVSPPTNSHCEILHPLTIPFRINLSFLRLILLIDM